jgi:hypothetical protein
MHLITPLICGVQGCGNGSASVCRRGTTIPATLFSSFEGEAFASSQLSSADRVVLDSYGRAQVYVNELCDVRCYNEAGELQIEFTAGSAASAVEVRSDSFSGRNYDTGAEAPGQPTTLQEVLDAWLTVRARTDWGDLSSQPFYIVTDEAYGATGDSITDDTTAITAALAAAAAEGGIVFFPPGTYRVTSTLTVQPGVSLLGALTSELQMAHATNTLLTAQSGGFIACLTLTATGTGILVDAATDISLALCVLAGKGQLVASSAATLVRLHDCTLTSESYATGDNMVHFASVQARLEASGCEFRAAAAYAPTDDAMIYGNNLHLDRCQFISSLVTSGTYSYVKFSDNQPQGTITGCSFGNPSSATVVAIELGAYSSGTRFFENGNNFGNAITFYSYTASSTGQGVHLGTRDKWTKTISTSSASVAVPTDQYGTVIVQGTDTTAVLTGTPPPMGSTGRVLFYHPSGGAGTAQPTTNFFGATAATTANTSTHVWEYVSAVANSALRMLVIVDGKALGNGAP